MFTGIITHLGILSASEGSDVDRTLRIQVSADFLQGLELGHSVAVNGVCLTVTQLTTDSFSADLSQETLSCTTLGALPLGSFLNLEKALSMSMPLGGHWVSGHVSGTGLITAIFQEGRSQIFEIQLPYLLMKYMAPKGSVTLDGISLTVNKVIADSKITINAVPHTLEHTQLKYRREGDLMNIEADMLMLYVERLMKRDKAPATEQWDLEGAMRWISGSRWEH